LFSTNKPGKMTEQRDKAKLPALQPDNAEEGNFRGYPSYPAREDIYNKLREEKDIDPEDISLLKQSNDPVVTDRNTGKVIHGDISGIDLDVPGSDLDDEQENIGSEDEENNFYSLGGDEHSN
jgi:hypothetical protein